MQRIIVIWSFLVCFLGLQANTNDELMRLEADMLKYFSTSERDTFNRIADRLKAVSKEAGQDRLYYKAWANQALYEATLQNYPKAFDMAQDIMDEAQKSGSLIGEYYALHAKATILLQKQSYDAAEKAFQRAVEFRHEHFPNESAGDDLQELMKIANHRKDGPTGVKYARQILAEPNVAPIHKGRALYRLSQMAFNKNDTTEFNRIYSKMMELKKTDGIGTLQPVVEVNHHILNGEYEQALKLADKLDAENSAERKAVIYHRMGDDENAFKYMQQYKKISDSVTLVSHGNVVASCFVQMNNERLLLEQTLLEQQNNRLRNRLYSSLAVILIVALLFIIYKRHRIIKLLQQDNKLLKHEKKDTERALEDLTELSFYESKAELPLNTPLKPNELCNRLTQTTQAHCHKKVTAVFLTKVPDDFEFRTNPDALKQLLTHLLDNAARFTTKGNIKLGCSLVGDNVRFTVTDTGEGIGNAPKHRFIDMLTEDGSRVRYIGMNFNICQSITRLLHGRIWFDKDYEKGTRFCVEIPREP